MKKLYIKGGASLSTDGKPLAVCRATEIHLWHVGEGNLPFIPRENVHT